MGGHAAGDVASRIAVEEFSSLGERQSLTLADLLGAVNAANNRIMDHEQDRPESRGMGTTLVGLAVVLVAGNEHWQVFNVGDSRVYRLDESSFEQLTVDHSEAEEMVALGVISRNEARNYERKNVVTRSLGTIPPPVADSWMFPASGSERFLLCSDGLTNELADSEIEEILRHEPDPGRAAAVLVENAVTAGGHDNVTAIVVDGATHADQSLQEDTVPRSDNGT